MVSHIVGLSTLISAHTCITGFLTLETTDKKPSHDGALSLRLNRVVVRQHFMEM